MGWTSPYPIFFPPLVKHLEVTVLHKIFFAQNHEVFMPVFQTEDDSAEREQPIMNAICHNHNLFPHPGNQKAANTCAIGLSGAFTSPFIFLALLFCEHLPANKTPCF